VYKPVYEAVGRVYVFQKRMRTGRATGRRDGITTPGLTIRCASWECYCGLWLKTTTSAIHRLVQWPRRLTCGMKLKSQNKIKRYC